MRHLEVLYSNWDKSLWICIVAKAPTFSRYWLCDDNENIRASFRHARNSRHFPDFFQRGCMWNVRVSCSKWFPGISFASHQSKSMWEYSRKLCRTVTASKWERIHVSNKLQMQKNTNRVKMRCHTHKRWQNLNTSRPNFSDICIG